MANISMTCLALSVVALAGGAASAQAASLAQIEQRGYMVVAVSPEASPFGAAADGKPAGFDAELLETLRRAAPFELRVESVPARDLPARLQSGEIDLAARSLEITQQLQASVAFGPPLAETTLYYLKRKDDDRITSLADLGGKRFGIVSGSAIMLQLAELEHRLAKAGARLGEAVPCASAAEADEALASGRVDYVVDGIDALAATVRSTPDRFAIGQPVAHETYVAWAVAKGNDALAAFLRQLIVRERATGELAALQQKWLARSFPDLPDTVVAQDWWVSRRDRPAVFPIPTRKDPD